MFCVSGCEVLLVVCLCLVCWLFALLSLISGLLLVCLFYTNLLLALVIAFGLLVIDLIWDEEVCLGFVFSLIVLRIYSVGVVCCLLIAYWFILACLILGFIELFWVCGCVTFVDLEFF